MSPAAPAMTRAAGGREDIGEYRGAINNCALLEPKELKQTTSRLAAERLSLDPSRQYKGAAWGQVSILDIGSWKT
jgi:hypothetical protein